MLTVERDVRCMGGSAHLVVRAPRCGSARTALDAGRRRLRELDRRWSRFRADSELTRLGRAGGGRTAVHADTWLLVSWCVLAWRRSGGRFDPATRSIRGRWLPRRGCLPGPRPRDVRR